VRPSKKATIPDKDQERWLVIDAVACSVFVAVLFIIIAIPTIAYLAIWLTVLAALVAATLSIIIGMISAVIRHQFK
jgi:hypothetical protein